MQVREALRTRRIPDAYGFKPTQRPEPGQGAIAVMVTHAPPSPPAPSRSPWLRMIGGLVVVVSVWIGVFAIAYAAGGGAKAYEGRVRWSAASGEPIPTDFRFLMFPAGEATLFEQPTGGVGAGELQRAVANTYEEIVAGGLVRVNDFDSPKWVSLEDLAYLPSSGDSTELVRGWRDFYLSPLRPTAYSDVSAKYEPTAMTGWRRVTLRLTYAAIDPSDGHDWEEYVYETDGASARAVERRRFSAKEAAFDGLSAVVGPGVLATFAAAGMIVALACVRMVTRRGRATSGTTI